MRSKRQMAAIMEKKNMTPVQGMFLSVFDDKTAISMNYLAHLMGCDASNITGLVDRLDSQGIIERVADPKDRRIKLIKLSEKGRKYRKNMLESLSEAEAADMQKLTTAEQEQLKRIIDKLIAD